jgi:tetratricopeptide (TPR) repeat protein
MEGNRRERLVGFLIVFIIVFGVYLSTLPPTVSFWDCGEFIAVSHILGVPHPPGSPLYVLIGRVVSILLSMIDEVAYRLNLLSAFSGALACALLYLVIVKIVNQWQKGEMKGAERIMLHAAAGAAALMVAFSSTFWDNSLEAEVYSPVAVVMMIVTLLALRWQDTMREEGSKKLLIVSVYLLTLSIGIHLSSMLIALPLLIFIIVLNRESVFDKQLVPSMLALVAVWGLVRLSEVWTGTVAFGMGAVLAGLALYALWERGWKLDHAAAVGTLVTFAICLWGLWKQDVGILAIAAGVFLVFCYWGGRLYRDWKGLTVLVFVLALTVQFYLIVRAYHDPGINEVAPTTWRAFLDVLERKQYEPYRFLPRKTDNGIGVIAAYFQQLRVYFEYFKIQFTPFPLWSADLSEEGAPVAAFLKALFGLLIPPLGLWGAWVHFRKDWRRFLLFALIFLITSVGLVTYLNMKYSPGDPNPLHDPDEVRERDYFFAASFLYFAFFTGIGAWAVIRWVRERLSGVIGELPAAVSLSVAVLLLSTVPLFSHYETHDRSGNWIPNDYGMNMLASCDENSVILTNGDNDTFPLWFVQEVKDYKKSVTVANLSLLNTPWYIKQCKRRGVPMSLTDDEIETLRPRSVREDGVTLYPFLRAGEIWYVSEARELFRHVTRDGETFCEDRNGRLWKITSLLVKDYAVRDIIASNAGLDLSIEELSLPIEEFLELVMPGYDGQIEIFFAVTVSQDNLGGFQPYLKLEGLTYRLVPERGESQIDVELTSHNAHEVFSYRGIFDPSVYKDANTQKLLSNYAAAFFRLGMHYREEGDLERAITEFEAGAAFNPPDMTPFDYHLSLLYIQTDQFGKAEERLRDAITRTPDLSYFYTQLGYVYHQQGRLDEAIDMYRQAIRIDPRDAQAYRNLLSAYEAKGDTQAVVRALENWVARNPGDMGAREMLDRYLGRGDTL